MDAPVLTKRGHKVVAEMFFEDAKGIPFMHSTLLWVVQGSNSMVDDIGRLPLEGDWRFRSSGDLMASVSFEKLKVTRMEQNEWFDVVQSKF